MHADRERMETLLIARATHGLHPTEATELDALLAAHPEHDVAGYERAAAAIALAALAPREALPERVRLALERRAAEFVADSTASR
jgi:hypothetical protein